MAEWLQEPSLRRLPHIPPGPRARWAGTQRRDLEEPGHARGLRVRMAAPDPQHGPQHGPRWALGPQRPPALPPAGRGAVAGRGLFVPTPSANPQCPRPEHTAASTPGALRRSQDADVEGLGCSGVGAPGHRAPRCSAAPPSRPLPRARTSCPSPVSARGSVRPPPGDELVSASPLPSLCPVVPGSNLVLIGGRARGPPAC